jgi:hypothetical protein
LWAWYRRRAPTRRKIGLKRAKRQRRRGGVVKPAPRLDFARHPEIPVEDEVGAEHRLHMRYTAFVWVLRREADVAVLLQLNNGDVLPGFNASEANISWTV